MFLNNIVIEIIPPKIAPTMIPACCCCEFVIQSGVGTTGGGLRIPAKNNFKIH